MPGPGPEPLIPSLDEPWLGEPASLVVTTDTGDQLHYLDWGELAGDLPPILAIHGLGATGWSWAPIARRLRNLTRVLAMDIRGHGLSESPRSGYDMESLAFDALTILVANGYGTDAAGPPAVVAGHGLGAMVAATMAGIQPASISGLALIDGGWEELGEATKMTAADFERTVGDPPEVMASMDAYLADRREFDPESWDTNQERAARAAVDEKHAGHVTPVVRLHVLRATIESMFQYRPIDALRLLPMPVMVAVAASGAADDETVRERRIALDDVAQARVAAGQPPLDIRMFNGAGHNLMRYRPAELAEALVELLEEAAAHQRS